MNIAWRTETGLVPLSIVIARNQRRFTRMLLIMHAYTRKPWPVAGTNGIEKSICETQQRSTLFGDVNWMSATA